MHEADMRDWKPQEEGEREPREGEVKPFSVMVAQSRGVKRLGVLRMDVDDLGMLLGTANTGLAYASALSAALALFFEGRVGRLCDDFNDPAWRRQEGIAADDEPDRGSVYCIYSGGDDLFIVGSWHLLPHLARRISDDLARYSGQNPYVHLSAGISLHGAKFPLYQAAEAAHEELERAKDREGKAALGFLEQVVAWEYADTLFDLVDKLDGYLREPTRLPRAILQTLQQLYVQYDAGITERRRRKRSGQFRYDPWVWRSMYQLTRIAKQVRGDDDEKAIREWVCDLRDNMLQGIDLPVNTGGRAIERVGLAARWTQLLIRKERDNGTRE